MARQPPVYSPLTLGAVAAALGAAGVRRAAQRAGLGQLLRERLGAEEVLLTSSGTHALQLALGILPEVAPGERVVALPAYSCFDLVTAAVGAGVRVRFYDVDPTTLSVDIDSLRAAVGQGVSGVVAANLYGHPLDWPAIRSVTEPTGVPVIEDAAQGIGTGTPLGPGGSVGDLTVLSFGRGKGWTGGGGGALLGRRTAGSHANDVVDRLSALTLGPPGGVSSIRTPIVTTAAWSLGRPALYGVPAAIPGLGLGETVYKTPTEPREIGVFSAALARRNERRSLAAIDGRRLVASKLMHAIQESSSLSVPQPLGGADQASFLRLPIVAHGGTASRLNTEGPPLGVQSGYPEALHRLPAAQPIVIPGHDDLPGSDELSSGLFTFPTHGWIGRREVEALERLLQTG